MTTQIREWDADFYARLEKAGFTAVENLKKDERGIWRGNAMRDGKTMTVGVDFKGNIGSQ